jgi:hypothetical protein
LTRAVETEVPAVTIYEAAAFSQVSLLRDLKIAGLKGAGSPCTRAFPGGKEEKDKVSRRGNGQDMQGVRATWYRPLTLR